MAASRSIVKVTTRAVSAMVALTAVFNLFLLVVLVFSIFFARYQSEQKRLEGIAPALVRLYYGELVISDTRAIRALTSDLLEKYHLSSLETLPRGTGCDLGGRFRKILALQASSCLTLPIEGLSQGLELRIESQLTDPLGLLGWSIVALIFAVFLSFGVLFTVPIRRSLERHITQPLQRLAGNPRQAIGDGEDAASEIMELSKNLRRFILERDSQRNRAEALLVRASIGDLAAQVAHDIRSPLAVLSRFKQVVNGLSPEERHLAVNALGRIEYIADQLLRKYSPESQPLPLASEHALSLIDTLISEKRAHFGPERRVDIRFEPGPEAFEVFIEVVAGEFYRMLSNIINNAVEAYPASAPVSIVEVGIQVDEKAAVISLVDQGKGIPADVQQRIAELGETHGKPGGIGLGLYHAKTLCRSWGGNLSIESQEGQGTRVSLTLPKGLPPPHFCAAVSLLGISKIVILDDDRAIHSLWKKRVQDLKTDKKWDGEVIWAFQPEDFLPAGSAPLGSDCLLLVDYDFGKGRKTGLQWLEEDREAWKGAGVILVSSLASEAFVQRGCAALGIQALDKRFIERVPWKLD